MFGRTAILAATFAVLGAGSASAATGTISTVAGNGTAGTSGDGGPAVVARLQTPVAVVGTPDGGFLVADQLNSIRRVGPDGIIRTVAGTGVGAGYSGDGGPATSAKMDAPSDVEQLADGSLLIADINNNAVRRVDPGGTMSTVVGDGSATFGGDGGPASAAKVRFPYDIALLPGGGYLIVDQDNNRIRRVGPDGIISTVAGNGTIGSGGDGGQATAAQLNDPSGVVVLPDGGFLIADTNNNRIRRVGPDGVISTFAGTTAGFGGDGGPATAAKLDGPIHLALLPDGGGVVIADWHNNRVRKVDANGVITTLAGDGTAASTGDGGPATAATLNAPFGVGVASDGDVLVAEGTGHRIRRIDLGDPPPPAAARPPVAAFKVSSGSACVGKPVTFDAGASAAGSGGPIVSYRFTAVDQAPSAAARQETLLAQAAGPTAQTQFGWSRAVDSANRTLVMGLGGARSAALGNAALGAQLPIPVWQRDPAVVTLTVTDASGATASAQQQLEFAQQTSTQPRTPCGDSAEIAKQKAASAAVSQARLETAAVQLGLGCAGSAIGGCTGTVLGAAPSASIADAIAGYFQQRDTAKQKVDNLQRQIDDAQANADQERQQLLDQRDRVKQLTDNIKKLLDQYSQMSIAKLARSSAVRRTRKRARATTLGAASYILAAGAKGTLTVPLSSRARSIVRRHGYLVFRQVTVAVGLSGKPTVKARTVVLKRKRAAKPKKR